MVSYLWQTKKIHIYERNRSLDLDPIQLHKNRQFSSHVKKYIDVEIKHGAMLAIKNLHASPFYPEKSQTLKIDVQQ